MINKRQFISMNSMKSFLRCCTVFTALTCTSHGWAEAPVRLKTIVVEGNQRIGKDGILASLGIAEGSVISADETDTILSRLFDLGYFSDAKVVLSGSTLRITVEENPVVNRVAFEGNKELKDDILKTEALLKPLRVFTESRLRKDAQRIQDLYRLKGHFSATVTPRIIRREQNRVDVIFEINEDEPTKVSRIDFLGNKKVSDSKLKAAIQTKESRWYRFFSSDDTYDPDRLNYDQSLLTKYYREQGYVDFVVKSAVAEISPDQKEFFITFTVDEGERYRVGDVTITSAMEDLNVKELEQHLKLIKGDWYSSKNLDQTISKLIDVMGSKGFAFVDVQPDVTKKENPHALDIVLTIQEGPKVYIDRITVVGNDRTDDKVLRRELRFNEGDPYNSHNQKISKQRLENLGYFKKVDIRQEPSDAPDKVNILVDVEEDRTGEISIGGGFSTADGPLANIALQERNFRGKGQDFGVGFTLAKRRNEFDISFTEPYFMDRELSAGVDLYRISQNKFFDQSFTQVSYGGALRIGYMLGEYLSQSWAYRLSFDNISNVKSDASRFIQEQRGRSTISSVGHGLFYDRRDSRIAPTEGYTLSMNNDLAGLGGTVKYFRTRFGASYYYPLMEEVIFSSTAAYGFIQKIGSKLRIVDRFSLGDESLRGFQLSGVGPRDKKTKDSLGGIQFYTLSNEVLFPSPLPQEFNLKLAGFVDLGSTYDFVEPSPEVIDSRKMRVSAGFGLRWKSPMGPIRIDFGFPIVKDKYDKTQLVHFGFSTRF